MLIRKEENDIMLWGIWKIEETTDALLSILTNTSELIEFQQQNRSESRIRERVAVRVLLKELLGKEIQIEYTQLGKPCIKNSPVSISISHTKGYAAVALSNSIPLGIDIEYTSDRVKRVRSMFINDYEFIDTNNEIQHLLLHWSAKESMYKVLSKEGIDIKEDFIIKKFIPIKEGNFQAFENYTERKQHFNIQYIIEDDYVLTLAYSLL